MAPEAAPPDPRRAVVEAGQVLADHGHADLVWGHVSLRDEDGRGLWLKRPGLGFDEVLEDDVQLLDLDGDVVEGDGPPHLERFIHTEVLRARPDVACVVHTHPEAATTLASTGLPLRPVAHEATLFVPPDIARFVETGDLIRTPELGAAVAEALGERNALLLVNHGVVVVGSSVPEAVFAAVLLEKACRMQLMALSAAGGDLRVSDDTEALAKRARCYSSVQMHHGWDYLRRRNDRRRR
ncbi:class II aldolase/adducin family protein [Nocardioides carbamazepini]|jgi:L-ribulose-5-phosphate 4-epimerase|uniref:class II aldolase/adducin family protein n=1 Tax=Nocardioides carbamazepini TaxID=2854259 RepID=UPI00214A8442|nr:class II aldolase/adducin family protein [Nocardioides carbamazepini]MCR1782709.1 class II aldolase/adducin family protein [Nocardioides carbamazepini]